MLNSAAQKRVPLDPSWKPVLECAALEVFEMMAGARLTAFVPPASNPSDESVLAPTSGQTAMVGMAGALCGMTSISCSAETAIKLASKMAGDEAAKDPAIVSDAMGELCNMVAGNFKAKITSLADHCMLSVPTVISGDNYVMQAAEPSEVLRVALDFNSSPIWVSLITQS
ncbi:MAG: chemotaxis protein CheX [Candidatus Acidiferrales bacterium]|jgi:chemotaxis protein CheX